MASTPSCTRCKPNSSAERPAAAKLADCPERNDALRANEEVPASIEVEVPATFVVEGGDVAEMQICEVDSWVLVEVGACPNGTDAVVNTEILSYRTTILLQNVDGVWRVEGGNEIDRWEGMPECPSERSPGLSWQRPWALRRPSTQAAAIPMRQRSRVQPRWTATR